MSVLTYLAPALWATCTTRPTPKADWSDEEISLVDDLVSFHCAADEYNELASLSFTNADTAIRQLFHFRESGETSRTTFSARALLAFLLLYAPMACLTYGIAVPSGLFVPSLLTGATLGRLFGTLLHAYDGASGTFADAGTYALVGAAAGLGGMSRMTISISVILLEATGDMQYVLPLMLVVLAARFAGNAFNDGLYDIHIALRRVRVSRISLTHTRALSLALSLALSPSDSEDARSPLSLIHISEPTRPY